MKDHLPFQARWTVKVLQWLLSREVSLEEMLQDEDVLSGVVTYLTKKVAVEKELPGQKEKEEKVSTLEKELDFVRCRLSGADQQRKNEVQDLEKRNSELREEVVKLTHKVRAAEKEIFDANFTSGTTRAALKKHEEELRDLRKKLEKTEQELGQRSAELERVQKEAQARLDRQALLWEDEKSRLMFMLEERDNALSEAREGQAAATREIVSVTQELEDNQERLALLEVEAVSKGVPLVKVGHEPVVGEKAAQAVAEKKKRKVDDEDQPSTKTPRRKGGNPDFDPISAVVGFSQQNMFELSDDARYTEKVNLDVESIPEPARPQSEKARPQGEKARPQGEKARPSRRSTKPQETSEKTRPQGEKALPQGEKARPQGEKASGKPAKPQETSEKTRPQGEKALPQGEKTRPQGEKASGKPVKPQETSGQPAPGTPDARRSRKSRSRRRPRRAPGEGQG